MAQGPVRADFRNDLVNTPSAEQDPVESVDKEVAPIRPRSDRWSHDGFDQMMKVQDRSYRPQKNERPRSLIVKVMAEAFGDIFSVLPNCMEQSLNVVYNFFTGLL